MCGHPSHNFGGLGATKSGIAKPSFTFKPNALPTKLGFNSPVLGREPSKRPLIVFPLLLTRVFLWL